MQTSILPFTADRRIADNDDNVELDSNSLDPHLIDEVTASAVQRSTVQVDPQLPLIGTHAPECIRDMTEPILPTTEGSRQGSGRLTLWNLRGSTQLYEYPSNCPVQPIARRWEDLNGVYIPAMEGLGYNLPPTINLRIGPSLIPDAGKGLFLDASRHTFLAGTVVGTYWGADTINQGLPLSLLEPGAGIPSGVRDDGGYLLRHGDYMVEADPDCAMGYINEGWEDANASFQPNPRNPMELLVVLKRTLPAGGIYEITINYGAEYWRERYHRLGAAARMKWQMFYTSRRHNSLRSTSRPH